MSASENIEEIIIKQKLAIEELEEEIKVILSSNLSLENETLKNSLAHSQEKLANLDEKLKLASVQNAELKNALFEQVYSQKISLINAAQKRADIYFKSEIENELNKLDSLEKSLSENTEKLIENLKNNHVDSSSIIFKRLDDLSLQASAIITEARSTIAKETGAFSKHSKDEFQKLKSDQITDDVVESIGKKNNIEAFVGGNLINKLGILFVILGIIAVSRFTFFSLPDTFKGVVMFAISGGLLFLGELINRRKTSIFSLGLTSGGVAGLYASLSISYFALGILEMYPAIFLCMLITAGAFVLSQRYNSQTIAAFALVGGYIPIVSIFESVTLSYGAMVYFVVLNLFALSISYQKKWKISMFIGFFLNLSGTVYITASMLNHMPDYAFGIYHIIIILYILFAFTIYTFIPVLSNYQNKTPFSKADFAVLGLNTLFSSVIMYLVFYVFNIDQFNGLLTIFFATTYILLGRFADKHFTKEKTTLALFYLTGLTFVVLIIPFQFGKEWLSLGWLIQAVVISAYGILYEEKKFKHVGLIIGLLCLLSFGYVDLFMQIDVLFPYKYFAITLGSIIILGAYAYKRSLASAFENGFKYSVLVNLWFYCIYVINLLSDNLLAKIQGTYYCYNEDFLLAAMIISVTFLLAYFLPRIAIITDKGVKIISVVMSASGILFLMFITSSISIYSSLQSTPFPIMAIASAVLISLSILAVLSLRNILMFFVLENTLGVEWLPFSISAYFLVILSQNLIAQYNINFTSVAISIIYMTASLAWIIYGFIKRFAFMRRFGLGLSILAIAKLFLIDLPWLTQGNKIISYFSFGIALLGISFVYQYFSKRFSSEGGLIKNVEKTNVEEDNH